MSLSSEQQKFLAELKYQTIWVSILKQLAKDSSVPPYKEGKKDDIPEEKKIHHWIYRSGFDRGTHNVLKTLGYNYASDE